MESPGLYAYLSYSDAPAGLDWLAAIGFDLVARQDDEAGAVVHAEMRLGSVVLMIATADADYDCPALVGVSTGDGLYLWFEHDREVDDWFTRAVGAGATGVIPPEDTGWGSRRARVLDPAGKEWSAGNYRPGASW
ncbi:VOC family protein [Amycolatopsis sp. NPDC004378]